MSRPRNTAPFLLASILALATLLSFHPVLDADFIRLDDPDYVTENSRVRSGMTKDNVWWALSSIEFANWHPLAWISHMLDVELYGLKPQGHHMTSLMLHVGNTLLLFLILTMMTGRGWESTMVAALFGLHPLHVESVAWISERKDVLSAFIGLTCLLAYLSYARRPTLPRYAAVTLLLALGLMAKPMLVTLPFVMALLDYWPLCRFARKAGSIGYPPVAAKGVSALRVLVEKVPLLLLVTVSSIVTVIAQQRGEMVKSTVDYPFITRLANALVSYVLYICKMLWPTGLMVPYEHLGSRIPAWQVALAATLLLVAIAAALRSRSRRPYVLVGWFWYFGMLFPVSGLVQTGDQSMADRYTYLPIVGLFVVFIWRCSEALGGLRTLRALSLAAAVVGITALAALTAVQAGHWRNTLTLSVRGAEIAPGNSLAQYNAGVVLSRAGRVDEAIVHFRRALALRPRFAAAHDNLGWAHAEQGRTAEALEHYQEALRIDPGYASAHDNLGRLLLDQGNIDQAITSFEWAVRFQPTHAEARNNLAVALHTKGRTEESLDQFLIVLRLNPQNVKAHYNAGTILLDRGDLAGARAHYQSALIFEPNFAEAHLGLGRVALLEGKRPQAAASLRRALELRPNFDAARALLESFGIDFRRDSHSPQRP